MAHHQLAQRTKGKLKARFAAVRVRVADGLPQRIRDKGQQHLPGDEAWLIGEHRMSGEKKYYLANLPAKTDLRTLATTIKARWVCEQAHQQMKEELGLDHFEGRSWQGLHRHALMTMIAYAFLQHRRLATARREKKNQWAAASANFARRTPRHPRTLRSTTPARCKSIFGNTGIVAPVDLRALHKAELIISLLLAASSEKRVPSTSVQGSSRESRMDRILRKRQRCSNKSTPLRTDTESPMRAQSTSIHSLDRKPRILVANAARQHSHQAALALLEAGFLGCYAAGVPVSHGDLGAPWRALVRRFSSGYEELPLLGE